HPLTVVAGLVLAGIERADQREERRLICPLDVAQGGAELTGAVPDLALQLLLVALPRQLDAALGQRALDGADEVGQLGWLEEVIHRAAAETVDGGLGVTVAGGHDHRGLRVPLAEGFQQPDAVAPGHLHVADHQRGASAAAMSSAASAELAVRHSYPSS